MSVLLLANRPVNHTTSQLTPRPSLQAHQCAIVHIKVPPSPPPHPLPQHLLPPLPRPQTPPRPLLPLRHLPPGRLTQPHQPPLLIPLRLQLRHAKHRRDTSIPPRKNSLPLLPRLLPKPPLEHGVHKRPSPPIAPPLPLKPRRQDLLLAQAQPAQQLVPEPVLQRAHRHKPALIFRRIGPVEGRATIQQIRPRRPGPPERRLERPPRKRRQERHPIDHVGVDDLARAADAAAAAEQGQQDARKGDQAAAGEVGEEVGRRHGRGRGAVAAAVEQEGEDARGGEVVDVVAGAGAVGAVAAEAGQAADDQAGVAG